MWAAALDKHRHPPQEDQALHARTTGKVERFNGTPGREWAYVRDYTSDTDRLSALADFLNYYNHERPHSALNGQPPIKRTRGNDFRVTVDRPPVPIDLYPVQLTIADVEPTS